MSEALEQKVRDWMTAEVVTVKPSQTVAEFLELLEEHSIHGAPVVDKEGKLCGVVSMTDVVMTQVDTLEGPGFYFTATTSPIFKSQVEDPMRRQVRDIMNTGVIGIGPDESLGTACEMLVEHGVQRLVVKSGDRLEGILSVTDVLSAIVQERKGAAG